MDIVTIKEDSAYWQKIRGLINITNMLVSNNWGRCIERSCQTGLPFGELQPTMLETEVVFDIETARAFENVRDTTYFLRIFEACIKTLKPTSTQINHFADCDSRSMGAFFLPGNGGTATVILKQVGMTLTMTIGCDCLAFGEEK